MQLYLYEWKCWQYNMNIFFFLFNFFLWNKRVKYFEYKEISVRHNSDSLITLFLASAPLLPPAPLAGRADITPELKRLVNLVISNKIWWMQNSILLTGMRGACPCWKGLNGQKTLSALVATLVFAGGAEKHETTGNVSCLRQYKQQIPVTET